MMLAHYRQVSETELKQIRDSHEIQETLVSSNRTDSPYGAYLTIGNWWHTMNFLLTEQESPEPHPLGKVVFSKTPLTDEEIWFDFGSIRYLAPNEVQELINILSNISSDTLVSRYNPALMAEYKIHPDIWCSQEQDEIISSLKSYYVELVAFFRKAARRGNYILTYITA